MLTGAHWTVDPMSTVTGGGASASGLKSRRQYAAYVLPGTGPGGGFSGGFVGVVNVLAFALGVIVFIRFGLFEPMETFTAGTPRYMPSVGCGRYESKHQVVSEIALPFTPPFAAGTAGICT